MDQNKPSPIPSSDAEGDTSAVSVEADSAVEADTLSSSAELPSWSKRLFVASGIGVVALIFVLVFVLAPSSKHEAVKQFTNVYSFVPEKISKSAMIQISVPEGVDEEAARSGITFSPEIKGSWESDDETDGKIVFAPDDPLRSKVYYAVNMDTGSVQMSGDFYVDEDPQIEAVFPVSGTESHEDSEITIVFNRPMVPLTTLSEQESIELPITITPETPGRFKWISTRNLQFVPETTLIPSSDYTVRIDEGLYSIDGLPIASMTHEFVTRPLRYEYMSDEQVGYRSPMIIQFNQAVDLDETADRIQVKRDDDTIAVDVEYGEVTYYDREKRMYVTEEDQSKVFVYQRRDAHGRSHLWDFDTRYTFSIDGAVPLFGTKDLTQGKTTSVVVPNIVKSVTAQSDRSSQVRPDLFDPEGTLTIELYDDVDIDSSDVHVKGLESIEYGERCKEDENGNQIRLGSGCEMESDLRTLIFSFDKEAFSVNESFSVKLDNMVTPDGFSINAEPIDVWVNVYPAMQILRTNGGRGTLDGLYVCTNVPLQDPGEDGLMSYIDTEQYIVYGDFSRSRYLSTSGSTAYDSNCRRGEFETYFRYGLMPDTEYRMSLSLSDEFGQSNRTDLSFTSESPKEEYTRFQNLQKQYNVTVPDRTTLTYAAENLEYMDMHICRMEPETFLARTVDRASNTASPRSDGCTEVVTERIELPKRYWVNNYFQVDLADRFADTRGHYILTFSNPLYRTGYYGNSGSQLYDRTYVSVTNLAIGKKEVEYDAKAYSRSQSPAHSDVLEATVAAERNLYWINRSDTLTAVSGASVTQYVGGYNRTFAQTAAGYSDGQGIARLAINEDVAGAVVRSGTDTAVVTDWSDTMQGAGNARDASRTYVYTDRPIYRPGHTVNIRGIDRIGFDGSYEVWNESDVQLEVFDAQGNRIYDVMLPQNDYGTFNTSFEIPAEAPLGTYRIVVLGQTSSFSVEEYVPAAFKLEAETNKDEYVNGDTLQIDVQADYYFGVPLSEGTVSYSVTAQDYYFDRYTDEHFNFGRGWYYCYSCGYGDDFLFRGETEVNSNGYAEITRELKFGDYFDYLDEERSKLVTVSITAKDINGRSVSMQKSFVVHKGEHYIGVKTDRYYMGVNSPLTLRVKTVDTNGEPVALSSIDRKVYKVHWETFKRQEVDGGFYYQSEKKLEEISNEKIKTDKNGDWSGELSFGEQGQFEVHVSKADGRGNLIKTVSNIYIYGSRAVSVPPNNNYELDLEVENTSLEVGDTASLLIKSPYENAKVLISAERGMVYDYWIVDVTGGLYLHEFPIKEEYAPNMFVSALLLSDDPEVKYGSVRYEIGIDKHEVDVSVTANKTHYLPGEEVTLRVETKDSDGRNIPAEVSLAVADLSVLALKGNPKKNPAVFFFDGFPLSVTTASNIRNVLHEVDIPLGTKGGGGADPDDLSKKKRGEFKDTAFWSASVETDASGVANVTFTLPDNLTTWQIEGLAVTKDTKLGVDYVEFTTKKDLMAVPLKPRFVVPGDTFSLGAKVFNQTESNTNIDVQLESDTLTFVDSSSDNVFINKGESKTVYFQVQAPTDMRAGYHTFTFTAQNNSFVDSVEQSIAITPNTTYETVATANFTKDDRAIEYIYIPDEVISGEGGLTINANATLAVFMTDALSYMVTYPYGCSEQLASSLSTIGTLTEALSLPNVEGEFDTIEHEGVTYTVDTVVADGLNRIYENQDSGGGFSYYKTLRPNLWLTMHVVDALVKLDAAGYEVRDGVIRRAVAYVESAARTQYNKSPQTQKETIVLAEYIMRQANGGKNTSLTSLVETFIDDQAFLNEKISSMSLAYLAILTADGFSRSDRNRVYDALSNRVDIDGRGAYLSTIESTNRYYFETPVKNTALLVKAFAAHEDEHPAMANTLRWLLAARDKQGAWGSTHNTFVVVDAMVDYLDWQHETESHFTLKGLLDGVELFAHEFSPANIFETFTKEVPIDDLERETLLPLVIDKANHNDLENNLYYDMSLKYFLPVESLPPRDEGITITRELYTLDDEREQNPVRTAVVGDVLKGKLTITVPDHYTHVSVEDMIPAGFEIVNFNLATEDQSLRGYESAGLGFGSDGIMQRIGGIFGSSQRAQVFGAYQWFGGSYDTTGSRALRPSHVESHDDRVFLYIEELQEGVYEYEYFIRALVPGEFQHLPARAEELFFPEVFGRTDGDIVTVTPQ